ncbi:MAG: hypothetical protein R6W97_00740 [Thiobacillus sp.]
MPQTRLEDLTRYTKTTADVVQAISEIDALIKRHAAILELIQPYAPGKISLRWIKPRGGAQTEPTFVAWKWTPSGRKVNKISHYDILKPGAVNGSIKRYGPFEGTQYDVRHLATQIKRLMERRKALTKIQGRYSQAVSESLRALARAKSDIGDGLQAELLAIHKRHAARVKNWQAKKVAEAEEAAVRDARNAIPDPSDYDIFDHPVPEKEIDEERTVKPDTYTDEDGNYVGP